MIVFSPEHLKHIVDVAEAAYPEECCGLLAGIRNNDAAITATTVTRVIDSANVAQDRRRDSFEVDPKVRFDLMRELEGSDEEIIGHYHSHPDHPALPSQTDLSMVYEPELVWLIISVRDGQAVQSAAFMPHADASAFKPLELRTTDWHTPPQRASQLDPGKGPST